MAAKQDKAGANGELLIGDAFTVSPVGAGRAFAGLQAWLARPVGSADDQSWRTDLVAVRTLRDAPPPRTLPSFTELLHPNLLSPRAFGPAGDGFWVVCDAPPGPSLADTIAADAPWSETQLVERLLRPMAQALHRFALLGLTHRGIRLSNLFASGDRVLLGPGCLAPGAFFQPALYESPYVGLCDPDARGAGSSADDVYALGVAMLELATGRQLLADLEDAAVVRRKFELGSFNALALGERLPPRLSVLLRSMLAEDPRLRPALDALAGSGLAAARPRLPRATLGAGRPLSVLGTTANSATGLALVLASRPEHATALLRSGTVPAWVRRGLEQPDLAKQIEEAGVGAPDNDDVSLLTRTIALLDPLMPMFWDRWLWPDALGTLLGSAIARPAARKEAPAQGLAMLDALRRKIVRRWSEAANHPEPPRLDDMLRWLEGRTAPKTAADQLRILAYSANPFLPCMSPRMAHAFVLSPEGLLGALEAEANASDAPVLDEEMVALLCARGQGLWQPIPGGPMREIVLLAAAQATAPAYARSGLPRIAARLMPELRRLLADWPGASRRRLRLERVQAAASTGTLGAMLAAAEDDAALESDRFALADAAQEVEALRRRREELAPADEAALGRMRDTAADIALGLGTAAACASLLFTLVR